MAKMKKMKMKVVVGRKVMKGSGYRMVKTTIPSDVSSHRVYNEKTPAWVSKLLLATEKRAERAERATHSINDGASKIMKVADKFEDAFFECAERARDLDSGYVGYRPVGPAVITEKAQQLAAEVARLCILKKKFEAACKNITESYKGPL